MKGWKGIFIGMLLASLLHIYLLGWSTWTEAISTKWLEVRADLFPATTVQEPEPSRGIPDLSVQQTNEALQGEDSKLPLIHEQDEQQGIYIGMPEDEVIELLGEPQRVEPSAYSYTWWIYNQDWQSYIQIGIKDGKLVTLYTNAPNWAWNNLSVGTPADTWQKEWEVEESVSFYYKLNYYTFDLTHTDVQERPLLLNGDTAIQLYIDIHHEEQISGIRLMDLETLLLHRPYALKYIGQLPSVPDLSEEEWEEIERSNEMQVFDIVNITRRLYQLQPFEWHGEVAEVARGHSLDMGVHDYFDHVSPVYGDLGDRLQRGAVSYRSAGENIAWNYVDGADAHQGWLNSLGHRKNIMQENFTHLGVGVIQKHYTQNFIRP